MCALALVFVGKFVYYLRLSYQWQLLHFSNYKENSEWKIQFYINYFGGTTRPVVKRSPSPKALGALFILQIKGTRIYMLCRGSNSLMVIIIGSKLNTNTSLSLYIIILTVVPHRPISCAAPASVRDASSRQSIRCRSRPAGSVPPL